MKFSSTPFLLIILFVIIIGLTWRARKKVQPKSLAVWPIYSVIAGLAAWAILSRYLAISGLYLSEPFQAWMPGLWVTFVPIVIVQAPLCFSAYRSALWAVIDNTPPLWFVYLQAIRIAAIGTLFKTAQGEFPLYFEIVFGIPDLLFGLSALFVAYLIKRKKITWRGLMKWHLLGFLIIAPHAWLFIQMGIPGLIHIFDSQPTGEALLEYPMVLAPSVIVPLFVLMNLWSVSWLHKRQPKLNG